jgi:hypothetical protein
VGIKKYRKSVRFCASAAACASGRRTGGQNDRLPESRKSMNAKEMTMNRSKIATTFALGAVLVLGLAPLAKAERADRAEGCSNATLTGALSQRGTGFMTSPPAMAGPMGNVGTLVFDGKGGLTGTVVNSLNGNTVPPTGTLTETGTYKMNPDCTGTYTVQIAGVGLTGHAFFVIDDNANELQILSTDPGTVILCVARRQFPAADSQQ